MSYTLLTSNMNMIIIHDLNEIDEIVREFDYFKLIPSGYKPIVDNEMKLYYGNEYKENLMYLGQLVSWTIDI